jgi:hypothetical protein
MVIGLKIWSLSNPKNGAERKCGKVKREHWNVSVKIIVHATRSVYNHTIVQPISSRAQRPYPALAIKQTGITNLGIEGVRTCQPPEQFSWKEKMAFLCFGLSRE